MIITPFAALDPYKPVAAASLRIVTDSISLGLAVPPIMPSTTYRGEDPAEIELDPRITILASEVGFPEELDTTTPAAFPCSKFGRLLDVTSLISSPEMTDTELDSSDCFLELYPTMTTSSKLWTSSAISTLISFLPLIGTSWEV